MNSNTIEDNSSDESSDWSSAEEVEDWTQDLSKILCLFCAQTFQSIDECLVHLKSGHNFDLIGVCLKNRLDSFGYIKLINYIRYNKPETNQISHLIETNVCDSEDLMKAVISDDRFLTFDIESISDDCDNDLTANLSTDDSNYEQLSKIQLIQRLRHSEQQIQELENKLKEMKSLVNSCLDEDIKTEDHRNVSNLSISEDSYYVSSYSHFGIHQEMLSDRSRTQAYEDSILKNSDFFKDKLVLDVGCGTGILSLFAAKAGAQLVVAVDQSDIIYKAIDISIENGLQSKIKFIKDKFESIDFESHQLPQKYDIIISEWMGYFLLFEGMLDSILYARNNLLSPSGVLLPNKTSLSIAGICDHNLRKRYIDFWDNVYGFKMSSMKSEVFNEALIKIVENEVINTSISVIQNFDLMECLLEETQNFKTDFQLISTSDEPVVAIVGWFDCFFDVQSFQHKVVLSTSPFSESTHWKQTVFYLKKPIVSKIGDKIDGNIKVYRNVKEIRSLVVEIQINRQEKQVFYLS